MKKLIISLIILFLCVFPINAANPDPIDAPVELAIINLSIFYFFPIKSIIRLDQGVSYTINLNGSIFNISHCDNGMKNLPGSSSDTTITCVPAIPLLYAQSWSYVIQDRFAPMEVHIYKIQCSSFNC